MSGNFLLDLAALALSLSNTILLTWLGLTVLLNAEKRTLGVWLAGDGLLIGAAFFISHSVFLGEGVIAAPQGLNFWWYAGWWPVVASPFAWYLLILWFTGFWTSPQTALFRRQLPWLVASVLFTLLLAGLIAYANPLPVFRLDAVIDLEKIPSLGGIPLLVIGYPLYILTCISLALDALLRPAPSSRLMGDQARQHARPWLIATSLVLLSVSLLVGWVMLWVVRSIGQNQLLYTSYLRLAYPLAWYDLGLEILITGATLMLGQALISYEVFTGQTLPRRGFKRQWRNAILFAAGISLVTTFSLNSNLNPVYTILLALMVMTIFFALTNWRAHVEREQSIRQLRPFLSSQRLYEQLLAPQSTVTPEVDLSVPFAALCRDVLAARRAVLIPLGPFAVLSDTPLIYPAGIPFARPELARLAEQFSTPNQILPLEGDDRVGFSWAVSLWSERGLVGLLLVGPKIEGGIYSEEEIEIARAGSERLLDIKASAEIARRLLEIQRQRMTESQLMDRQTRRVLHDEVLPQVHAALLALSGQDNTEIVSTQETTDLLIRVHHQIADLLHAIPPGSAPEVGRLGLIGAMHQVIENELGSAFDSVRWQVSPEASGCISNLSPLASEVVYYAARETMRNSARYARSLTTGRPLNLKISAGLQASLVIEIEDDGIGIASGSETLATAAENNRISSGHGLALHSALLAVVGGSLTLESIPDQFTRVRIQVPPGLSS